MKILIKQKIEEINILLTKKISEGIGENDQGLMTGDHGILLFILYHISSIKKSIIQEEEEALIELVINNTKDGSNPYAYCDGLPGILCLFDILRKKKIIDINISDSNRKINNYLTKAVEKGIATNNYDFLHGTPGSILYFSKTESNKNTTNKFIDGIHLNAIKNTTINTFKWESYISNENSSGYNLSLAHGMSSTVILLSRLLKNEPYNKKIKEMINGTINFFFSQELDTYIYGSYYPPFIIKNKPVTKSRMGWCYGDLGVALAMWQAGKVMNQTKWKDKALEVFLYATTRKDPDTEFVKDAGICHGSAGLAMIFRRMYLETGIEEFKTATDHWINETLKNARFEDGLAGYKRLTMDGWENDYSLIMGIAGIGLVLISYLTNDAQEWDELFLLS